MLPAARREDRIFRDWVVTNTHDFVEIARRPTRDTDAPEDVIAPTRTTCPPPTATASCGSPPPRPAAELSLYPEDRGCTAPTTARILEIFTAVARHELTAPDSTALRTFHPELTELQHQVLDLLDIPSSVYSPAT